MEIEVTLDINAKYPLSEGEAYLYHIRRDIHKGVLSEGYIGVTTQPRARWLAHRNTYKGANPHLTRALLLYSDIRMVLISRGIKKEMLAMEEALRPSEKVGWNLAKGGGLPPYKKGFKLNPESIKKREETRKSRPDRRSKDFELISPQGERIVGCGAIHYANLIGASYRSLYRLLSGTTRSVNGWTGRYLDDSYKPTYKVKIPKPKPKPKQYERHLVSPEGTLVSFKDAKAFAKEHDLCLSSVYRVLWGKNKTTKGWRLPAK